MKSDYVGAIFPTNNSCNVKVISYENNANVVIEFQDDHRLQKRVYWSSVVSGHIKNPYEPSVCGVGYLGFGDYKLGKKGGSLYIHKVWEQMIRRCYGSKYREIKPWYNDCSVCDEWLNFQNFAKWFVSQEHYNANYELDKDILLQGNRVYCPEFCRLVPSRLNRLLTIAKKKDGNLPIGVSFSKQTGLFMASIRMGDKGRKHLGSFKEVSEAHEVYVSAKESYVKSEAEKYKGCVDADVYEALTNWSFYE